MLVTLLRESFEDVADTEEPSAIADGIIHDFIKTQHIVECNGRISWKQQAPGLTKTIERPHLSETFAPPIMAVKGSNRELSLLRE